MRAVHRWRERAELTVADREPLILQDMAYLRTSLGGLSFSLTVLRFFEPSFQSTAIIYAILSLGVGADGLLRGKVSQLFLCLFIYLFSNYYYSFYSLFFFSFIFHFNSFANWFFKK